MYKGKGNVKLHKYITRIWKQCIRHH